MGALLDIIKNNAARRTAYFAEAKADIRATNMNMVCAACAIASALLLAFLIIAPLVLRGWTPSVYHLAFVPVMLLFTAIVFAYRSRSASRRWARCLCVACMCVLFSFCSLIDVFSDPAAPSSFMPSLMVAMPALFILPISAIYAVELAFAAGYCVLATLVKSEFVAPYDIFQVIVGIAFSVCIAHLIMNYRVQTHESRRRYQELAMRDALSDIFNKRAFADETERLVSFGNPAVSCAVVIIDVDDFKHINDDHGHLVGDRVLQAMGNLLKEHFRATDIIGRFGGDEFVVFVNGAIDETVLARKLEVLQKRFAESGRAVTGDAVSCSIGAVLARAEAVELNDLLAQADDALYESKQLGKSRFTLRPHLRSDDDPATTAAVRMRAIEPADADDLPETA